MPLCPVHNKPMKEWPDGGASCSVRVGVGMPGANAKGYCNQAIRVPRNGGGAPPTPPVQAIPRDVFASKADTTNDTELRKAALEFASRYGATSPEDAFAVAAQALRFLKGEA